VAEVADEVEDTLALLVLVKEPLGRIHGRDRVEVGVAGTRIRFLFFVQFTTQIDLGSAVERLAVIEALLGLLPDVLGPTVGQVEEGEVVGGLGLEGGFDKTADLLLALLEGGAVLALLGPEAVGHAGAVVEDNKVQRALLRRLGSDETAGEPAEEHD